MKRFYTIATALLLVAGSFTSCTKDLDEVSLNASTTDAAKGVKTTNQSNQKDVPVITMTYTDSPAIVGKSVTVNISVAAPAGSGQTLTSGNLILQQLIGADWVEVAKSDNEKAAPSLSYSFVPEAAGTIQWNVKYTGGGRYFENVDLRGQLEVIEACEGATLTSTLVSATPVDNGLTEYKVAFTLTSCEAYNNAKLQGGISATIVGSVEAVSADGVMGNIRYNNRNAVVSWDGLNLTKGYSNTFYVTFRMEKADKENPIGDWTVETQEEEVIASATL